MTRREFGFASLPFALCSTGAGQDVGNHYPLIESLAVTKPKLSWLEPRFRDVKSWKREAQAKYLELLHYAPAAVEPRAEVLSTEDHGDYTLDRIVFSTTPALRVPAFV